MADKTTSLQIDRPGQQGQQYIPVATGFEQLDQAIAQRVTLNELAAGDHLLTEAQFRYAVLVIPALPADRILTVPARSKLWLVDNTDGGHTVTVKCAGQPGQSIPSGQKKLIFFTGVDFSEISPNTTDASLLTSGTLPDARLSANVPLKVGGTIQSADLPAASGAAKGAMSSAHYTLVNGATSAITASTLVQRDASSQINAAALIGGSTANNVLTLQANSAGSGNTSTNAGIQFKVGNSGGTIAATINNNGVIDFPVGTFNATAGTFTFQSFGTTALSVSNSLVRMGPSTLVGSNTASATVGSKLTVFDGPLSFSALTTTTVLNAPQLTVTPSWVVSTGNSQKARVAFNIFDTAAREAIRLEADGAAPRIGFFGAAAVARQTVSAAATDAATTQTLVNDIRTALVNYGLAV